ncbi:hypothetical protein [Stappia sp. MMSF_3263]|uniref:hypothetical protein n=1 Tax=Stappia sp. MMSF_3263 TaxID=3046693 RepID=UPI00273E9D05|nr:hypothetical protein [Stappia sp. MMSF_3263]
MLTTSRRTAISGVATLVLALPTASLAQTQAPAPLPEAIAEDPASEAPDRDTASRPAAGAQLDASVLQKIVVPLLDYLGSQSPADIGTTSLDRGSFVVRTDGSGDANTFLRGLPNVQYQNETDTDAGIDGQQILNTRPELLSISGGRIYENNFIVNGIPANTVTGSVERDNGGELTSDENTPNADRVYGLHPQTIFVPSDFVESATVIDSNAQAKYGNFQGGVVSYELNKPDRQRWKGTASVAVESDRFVNYVVATEDGTNPLGRKPPEFTKIRSSFSLSGPVNEVFSVIAQYSRTDAATKKQKDYIYLSGDIREKSLNAFYRLQVDANTDFGTFSLEGMVTDYSQGFESQDWRDLQVNVSTLTYAGKLKHSYTFGNLDTPFGQILGLTLDSKAVVSHTATRNETNSDVARVYQIREGSARTNTVYWTSSDPDILSWCRVDPTTTGNVTCREGGYGANKEQGQTQYLFSQNAAGSIWAGTFEAGYDLTHTSARRARENDFTYYTSVNTLWDARALGLSQFNCLGSEACSSDQYANIKTVWDAHDTTVTLNSFDAWLQFEQSFGWLTVRPGLRLQVDDYQKNVNLAPRIAATITPIERIELSAGFNRYYNGGSLEYAIRDNQPRGQAYLRGHDGSGNVTDTWTMRPETGVLGNKASDLRTPYTDEWTAGIKIVDPLTEGTLRLRYINRAMKDQYASADLGNNTRRLTNSGTGAYESATAEYARTWDVERVRSLDRLTLTGSFTWSAQELSPDSYFYDEDDLLNRILYNGRSYSVGGFSVVTGNLDIPMRAQLAMMTNWYEGKFSLGVAANYNFPFTGVQDTGRSEVFNGIRHDVWEDKDFDGTLTVDLHSSLELLRQEHRSVRLNLVVDNLFNEIGNASAGNSNPFRKGRSFWLGLNTTF